MLVATSAALNLYLFFRGRVPEGIPFYYLRLNTSIGMPAYANSTNISSTYAIFFVSSLATALRGRLPVILRGLLVAAATILLAAFVPHAGAEESSRQWSGCLSWR